MKHRIKLNGLVLFLSALAVVLFPRIIIRQEPAAFDGVGEVLGVSLVLAGQLLRVSARGYKSEQSYSGNHLVTAGPYSLVRHPMYLGLVLIGCGVVLAALHPWTLVVFFAGFLFRYRHLFAKEEAALARAFGNEYEDYCRRVPRIIPAPLLRAGARIPSFFPMRLSWFMRELPSILGILALVLVIGSWTGIVSHGWGYLVPGIARLDGILCSYFLVIFLLARKYERTADKSKHYSKQAHCTPAL